MWCWSSVCPHRAIVNLLQPTSTQCGVGPVCVHIELLSTYFNPMCVHVELLSTYFNQHRAIVNLFQPPQPMWCWSSVCPHRAIVNLFQPPQPMWCWSSMCPHRAIVNLFQPPQPMWCWSSMCPHRAIVNHISLQQASKACVTNECNQTFSLSFKT